MSEPTLNQYAPPRADVADMSPGTAVGELKLFSAQGRIGRLRYLAYSSAASVVYSLVVSVSAAALAGSPASTFAFFLSLLALLGLLWFNTFCGIKRCHDLDISGWWSLTLIVPVIVLAWMFMPGSRGENRFGPPPPSNTWGVRVLGVIMPVVFIVGILAAVAIPQYKHYTDQARAAAQR
ncbi:DUF805 domain-containing protein [Roseateles sp.]|uniref:DUF805 domain-containing protein n=1 Tax=Roseateles sp. TaxID=1971397 RepID=UPI003266D7D2